MKKIIYFGGFELPDKNAAAQRVRNIGKLLEKLNIKVLYAGISHKNKSNFFMKKNNSFYEKKYPKSNLEKLKDYVSINQEIALLKKEKNTDGIILYNYPAIKTIRINKYCKKKNIKVILDITEWYNRPNLTSIYNLIKLIDIELRMNYLIPKINNIIFTSENLLNYYKIKTKNTIIIPGLVDVHDLVNIPRKKINKSKKEKIKFLYLGNPGKKCEKERVDLLIKAICEINEKEKKNKAQLDIIGVTKKEFEENFKLLKKNKSYENNILFHGKLVREKALELLSKSDVSTIVRENTIANRMGFPTKLGESLALGVPVLITSVGDMKNYIIDGKNGYIIKDCSYNILKKKIKTIIKEYENNEMNDINAMGLSIETFDRDAIINFLEKLK